MSRDLTAEPPTTGDSRFHHLARWLLYRGRDPGPGLGSPQAEADKVFPALRAHLAARFGTVGFDAILNRAIRLTSAAVPSFGAIKVDSDGSLKGIDELLRHSPLEQVWDGLVLVLANVFGVVATFVGDDLTFRLVRSKWPDADASDLGPELKEKRT